MSDRKRSASAEPRVAVVVDPQAAPDADLGSPTLSRWARSTVSGWEIALWAFGLLLVIVSVQVNVSTIETQYTGGIGSFPDEESAMSRMIYSQSLMSLSPGAFTAGLFSIALAIAIRALKSFGLGNSTIAAAAPRPTAAPSTGPVASAVPETATSTPRAAAPVAGPPAAHPAAHPADMPSAAQVSANRLGVLRPTAQPDRVTPVPVVEPTRATSTSVPPAVPTTTPAPTSNPRRRAETDNSMFMRPPATSPHPQPNDRDPQIPASPSNTES